MKKYNIELSENGWEYTGHISIDAESVEQLDKKKLIVNGAIIEFDEEIVLLNQDLDQ